MRTAFGWLIAIPLTITLQHAQQADKPWDTPFSGDTKAALDAARSVSTADDSGAVVLLEEHRYVIDKSGRMTSTIRKVYRVLKLDENEAWSSMEQEYAPWYQNRPEFRARVIRPDGTTHWLDPKTIADSPAQEFDPSIYSDRRILRAPLPAVIAGAVVEFEIVVRESSPLLDAGVATRVAIADHTPIERFRLTVEAAKGITLRTASQNIAQSAIRRQSAADATRIQCELGPITPRKSFEWNLPSDVSVQPYFSFSTGSSWQAVATRFQEIVNQQVQNADLKPILDGVDLAGKPLDVVSRLTARLHKEIRYTGVEFGEAAIVPRTPAEVLERKYGDCKDKAALLVAMLRAAGLRADVALLNAGFGVDADPELPGLGQFNHAIVHVAGESPIWIDATSPETRVGGLPLGDQGRLALIANRDSSLLVRIAGSQSTDNRRVHTIEVRMSELGHGEFQESIEATGFLEAHMRQLYDGRDDKKTREALEQYVKQHFQAKSLGHYAVTVRDDFSSLFRLNVRAQQARSANTLEDDAVAVIHPYLVFEELPHDLTGDGQTDNENREPRKHDFVFHGPHQVEYRYRIHPPRSFRPRSLPASMEVSFGSASYSRKFQRNEDGTVAAVFRFDSGKQRLSPPEFEALRKGLSEHTRLVPQAISFVSEASELMALGETRKALKLVRDNATAPASSAAQVRLSRMLVKAGAVQSAIAVARRVTQASPDFSPAWQALGWAYQHDSFGRRFRGDWNRTEAERCYREAVKVDPDDFVAQIDLAILLEHNFSGQRYGKGAQLDEVVGLYRQALKSIPGSELQQNLALSLLFAGRYAEASEEIKKLPDGDAEAALHLTHTALTESAARAIIESQSHTPESRVRAVRLGRAAYLLIQLREYAKAHELVKAASRLLNSSFGRQMEPIEKVKRYEDLLVPSSDPRYPVQQIVLEALAANPDVVRVKSFLTSDAQGIDGHSWLAALRRNITRLNLFLAGAEVGEDHRRDVALSLNELTKVGDTDRGYRVSPSDRSVGFFLPMYVVSENGEYKILGDASNVGGIGKVVLDLLERQNMSLAQWWLDTVVPDLRPESPYGTGGPAARFLWSGITEETRGPSAIRMSAASMLGRHTASPKSIRILQEARTGITNQTQRSQLDLALCESLERAKHWKELLLVGRRMALTKLFADDGFRCVVRALTGLKEWSALQAEARRRLNKRNNSDALRAIALSLVNSGDRAGAAEYFKKLSSSMFGTDEDRFLETWNLILMSKADEEAVKALTDREVTSARTEPDYWYTLGMLQAALGRPEDAQRSLAQALERGQLASPHAKTWALFGRICEAYGIADCAEVAYTKAASGPQPDIVAEWAASLVSDRRAPSQ